MNLCLMLGLSSSLFCISLYLSELGLSGLIVCVNLYTLIII